VSGAAEDPLRRLARERGRTLGELGLRPSDAAWARSEADAIASLTTPSLRMRMPALLERFLRRLARLSR
jgi:hypothetical protein